ncbi:Histidine decarboxylase, partial [Intoshia linei]
MDSKEYETSAKNMVDYIADYLNNVHLRPVYPSVNPGYMRNLVPKQAPEQGEQWQNIFNDIEKIIMPGVTHWQNPHMHAYFPSLNSFPSLLGDMLADAINAIGFTWASCPACTELEAIVMDWLAKMIGLPEIFLNSNDKSNGGGCIQTTASEATYVSLLTARSKMIQCIQEKAKILNKPVTSSHEINAKLVAYCSDQAHSSVVKACTIALIELHIVESNDALEMTGTKYDIWMHVDAAYAGSALVCPEYKHLIKSVSLASTFAFNPSKWLMVHFDCTAMWIKNISWLHSTFVVNPLYLKHENADLAIDYMHWQIPLSRRFRALKLWFVIRSFGVEGLQKHIRKGVRLAEYFEINLLKDDRFHIPAKRNLGLVVFRLKGENELSEKLLKHLNKTGHIYCIPAQLKGLYVIRFTITSQYTTEETLNQDLSIIKLMASNVLNNLDVKLKVSQNKSDKIKSRLLKSTSNSLVLSNLVNQPPHVINSSFMAMSDVEFPKIDRKGVKKYRNALSCDLSFSLDQKFYKKKIKTVNNNLISFNGTKEDSTCSDVHKKNNEGHKNKKDNSSNFKYK